MKFDGFLNNPE